jgi:hypothetical protein
VFLNVKIINGLGQGLGPFTFIVTNVSILLKFIIACVQIGGNTVITVTNILYCKHLLNLFRFVYVCSCHKKFLKQVWH